MLGILLMLALAVMFDRFWSLRHTILDGDRIVQAAAGHAALGYGELEQLTQAAGHLPEAAVLYAALNHLDTARGENLDQRMDEAIMLIAPSLDRRLCDSRYRRYPPRRCSVLFGTIVGMFHAFSVLAAARSRPG